MEFYNVLIFIFTCIISYLLGGVSIARLITKKDKGGNINKQGSGNPGTMNMLRTHGLIFGLFTLFCDALKGSIPALFGLLYFGNVSGTSVGLIALYLFGFFAVLGHIFPVFYGFKGGKGIATTFGVFMVADPLSTIILFIILFVTLYFIKIGSIVSLLFITIDACVQLFKEDMQNTWFAILVMLLIVILDIFAHRANIVRIIEDKENPADLGEAINKDINKISRKKTKSNLGKNNEKALQLEVNKDKVVGNTTKENKE